MEFKCCNHILGSIDLSFNGFKYCNEVWEGPEFIPYSEENAFEKNEKRRIEIIEQMKQGVIPERCKLCPMLEEKTWKEFDGKIHKITVFNWKHCNAACFYCSVHIEQGRLTNETFVAFMGGEPTMLEEFPKILQLLLSKNCKLEVLTNGIKCEPVISEMLKADNHNMICISVDCGTRESYKRIKRVDKFDEVKQTIKNYIQEAQDKANRVKIKYIIFPNVNDNKKEIDSFFSFCSEIGVKTVARAVNHVESKMSTTKNQAIESSVIKAYKYFEEQAKKLGFELQPEPWADAIVENKVYNCRKISLLTRIKSEIHFLFGNKK